jgi:hypothetical protein
MDSSSGTKYLGLLLFYLSLTSAVSLPERWGAAQQQKANKKIAVIGGGVSGLFAARELKKQGYSNIVVYEAGSELAGTTDTYKVKDGVHDLSTNFIPVGSFFGGKSDVSKLFEEYGLETQPLPKFKWLFADSASPSTKTFWPGPHIFADLEDEREIAASMLFGFQVLKEAAAFETVLDCEKVYGNTLTWSQLSQVAPFKDHPAFTRLAAFMTDAMLSGSSQDLPACYTIMLRADWMAATIASVLVEGQFPPLPFLDSALLELMLNPQIKAGQTRDYCPVGYQKFFEALAEQEELDIHLNSPVTRIETPKNAQSKIKLWVGEKRNPHLFDYVVVAARPKDARRFLEDDHSFDSHFEKVKTSAVESFLVEYDPAPNEKLVEPPFSMALYPTAFALASGRNAIDSISSGAPVGIQALDNYAENHLVAIAYSSDLLTMDQSEAVMKESLNLVGFPVKEIVAHERYQYSEKVNVEHTSAGWHSDADSFQGENNIFFVGEALAGPGVPAQLKFVQHFIPKWFPSGVSFPGKGHGKNKRTVPSHKATTEEDHELEDALNHWRNPWKNDKV